MINGVIDSLIAALLWASSKFSWNMLNDPLLKSIRYADEHFKAKGLVLPFPASRIEGIIDGSTRSKNIEIFSQFDAIVDSKSLSIALLDFEGTSLKDVPENLENTIRFVNYFKEQFKKLLLSNPKYAHQAIAELQELVLKNVKDGQKSILARIQSVMVSLQDLPQISEDTSVTRKMVEKLFEDKYDKIESLNSEYTYFSARPSDLTMSFDTYIAEKTKQFVGRRFIIDELDNYLINNDSGYFLIIGDPGVGKSAIISHLILTRGYIHHFNIALQNIVKPKSFIESICYQIMAKYDLPFPKWSEQEKDDRFKDGAFLNQLLVAISKKLSNDNKLIIAVDALDEVDTSDLPVRANTLYLPASLPANVYFILTTRNKYDMRLCVDKLEPYRIVANSENNTRDLQMYIETHLKDKLLQKQITSLKINQKYFRECILAKSEGNFMYLRHIIPEIIAGKYKNGLIEDLPDGLIGYYRSHWRQMQIEDREEFENYYQPVICVLAAIPEALTIDQISSYTKINPIKTLRIIREWREFLYENKSATGEYSYRLYHKSFQDFLSDEVDPNLITYKTMIADYYLKLANVSDE